MKNEVKDINSNIKNLQAAGRGFEPRLLLEVAQLREQRNE